MSSTRSRCVPPPAPRPAAAADSRQMILDPALYPLYIADVDGVSHTTLVVACLRKLQGWHMDSIIDEISRCVLPAPALTFPAY